MKVKLDHIAAKTGYSISTVSRVLSGKAVGRSASVEKILFAARELGYRTNRPAYQLENLPLEIALVTQHDAEEFYSCLYESFDRMCSLSNIHLTIHSIKHSTNLINQLRLISMSSDGIVLMAPTLDNDQYKIINENINSFPIISIAPVDENMITTITFDSYRGGRLAAKLLCESGHQRFGIITGPLIKWEANLRRNGYIDYLNKEGFHIQWEHHGDYSFRSGEKAFNSIEKQDKSLGIFSSNDQMALGFMHSALENGYTIPGDFGMVGYDNMPYSKVFYPKLSTVNTNLDDLAESALDYLKYRIKNKNVKKRKPTTTLLPVNIVKRKTHYYN
jgi:DNA-binding LacI/PurR family transcriptional regulator